MPAHPERVIRLPNLAGPDQLLRFAGDGWPPPARAVGGPRSFPPGRMPAAATGESPCVGQHRFSAPARPQAVPELRTAVVACAGEQPIDALRLADLKVAVSEAVSNAVLHAFREGEPGTVTVTVDVEPDRRELRVVVSDDGLGLTPRPDSPGLGLGLPLISQLAERVDVRTPSGGRGTELCMTFPLTGVAVPAGAGA